MYQYTDDCRLGIPEIDSEHEHLFSIVNDIYTMLTSGTVTREKAHQLTLALKEYANTHFAHEEAYMKKLQDPELASQKQEHEDFTARIGRFSIPNLSDEQLPSALSDLADYLSRWLFRHIIGSDTLIGKFESPFAFTSKYLTEVELIDSEHKRLFEIIAEANELIHAELLHDKYDAILDIIEQLKDYTEFHFHDEEVYMESINYPDLSIQKKTHAAFIEKLNAINLDDLDENQQDYLENLIQFLLSWLSVHILQMDKRIGEFAATLK